TCSARRSSSARWLAGRCAGGCASPTCARRCRCSTPAGRWRPPAGPTSPPGGCGPGRSRAAAGSAPSTSSSTTWCRCRGARPTAAGPARPSDCVPDPPVAHHHPQSSPCGALVFLPVAHHHPQRKALRAAPFRPSPATAFDRAPAGRSLFYPSSTALDGGPFESLARLASPATWGFGASEGRQGAEGNMGPDAAGRDQGSAGRAPRRPGVSGKGSGGMGLEAAQRQLEALIPDARVSVDCIALDALERSHTNAITARAAVDAAEYAIRVALEERRKAEEAEESEEAKGAGG